MAMTQTPRVAGGFQVKTNLNIMDCACQWIRHRRITLNFAKRYEKQKIKNFGRNLQDRFKRVSSFRSRSLHPNLLLPESKDIQI